MIEPQQAEPAQPFPADQWCALCGERCWPDDFIDAVGEAICPLCLEDMTYAHYQQ